MLRTALGDLASAWRQHRAPSVAGHRPYPMRRRPWVMGQSWLDVLFAHWRVDAERLRAVMPAALEPDLIDGGAWMGIVGFEVRALRPRLTLPAPLISSFPQLNVRTYVTVGGEPGVFFMSLDAASRLAVAAARRAYRLPYFHARMCMRRRAVTVELSSDRDRASGPRAGFRATYSPLGEAVAPVEGSLEWRLTERYSAYALDERKRVLRAQIHHPPWELRPAQAEISENTMTAPFGIVLEGEPLLHFASRQDAVIWLPELAGDSGG